MCTCSLSRFVSLFISSVYSVASAYVFDHSMKSLTTHQLSRSLLSITHPSNHTNPTQKPNPTTNIQSTTIPRRSNRPVRFLFLVSPRSHLLLLPTAPDLQRQPDFETTGVESGRLTTAPDFQAKEHGRKCARTRESWGGRLRRRGGGEGGRRCGGGVAGG